MKGVGINELRPRLSARASHMIANPPIVAESLGAIWTLFCAGDAPKQKPPDLQTLERGLGLTPSGPIGSKKPTLAAGNTRL